MLEKVKPIVAIFLRTDAGLVSPSTVIDRGAVGSSVHVHRMYAKLAAEGIVVKDYQEVITVGDLLQRIDSGNSNLLSTAANEGPVIYGPVTAPAVNLPAGGIGIDMEEVSAMPATDDFRAEPFYTMNFAPSEIAWCILQSNPYASFAGLFAAKEAIVKADNSYKNKSFNNILVQHHPGGQPFHTAFHLSISHTDILAIAIARPVGGEKTAPAAMIAGDAQKERPSVPGTIWVLALASFLLSLLALFLAVKK